jgi:GNAT superfamily N-acetyltransferase
LTPLYDAIDATWPAAALRRAGPWIVRDGQGGGKRVSAVTAADDGWRDPDIAAAEDAQTALGQEALFMIRAGEDRLDAALAGRGYVRADPVVLWQAPVAALADDVPPLAAFAVWPPLQIMRDIWAGGEIDAARLAVMDRVAVPKAALFGRVSDRPASVAFVAASGGLAMLHALHVADALRRQGSARHLMRAAAAWAQVQGAATLTVLVTEANAPANALYASLGMVIAGRYHYRLKSA